MKQELTNLAELIRQLCEIFDDKRYVTISVIVHNMAFNADNFSQLDYEPYLKSLKMFRDCRPDRHISNWVYNETSMIIDGHFMSISDVDLEREYFELKEI